MTIVKKVEKLIKESKKALSLKEIYAALLLILIVPSEEILIEQ